MPPSIPPPSQNEAQIRLKLDFGMGIEGGTLELQEGCAPWVSASCLRVRGQRWTAFGDLVLAYGRPNPLGAGCFVATGMWQEDFNQEGVDRMIAERGSRKKQTERYSRRPYVAMMVPIINRVPVQISPFRHCKSSQLPGPTSRLIWPQPMPRLLHPGRQVKHSDMAVSINWGSFLVGVLTIRALLAGADRRAPCLGNSHVTKLRPRVPSRTYSLAWLPL